MFIRETYEVDIKTFMSSIESPPNRYFREFYIFNMSYRGTYAVHIKIYNF